MKVSENKNLETFKINGDWSSQAKVLKGKLAQLTDADLKFEVDQEGDLLKRMGLKLNKKREEIINIIKKGMPLKA